MPVRRPIPAIVLIGAGIAALYNWALVALTPRYPGVIGFNINALGTDWMPLYGGARWWIEGNLDALFDGQRLTAHLNSTLADWLSQPLSYRPWVYPPTYLFVALPFGTLPFGASYVTFQAVTAGLLVSALWFSADRPAERRLVVAAALLSPAAAISVGLGQNTFLTAAMIVTGFRCARARPALAGIILGMLTVKPQHWLLVPVALVAARDWRVLAWSFASALGLALASAVSFGLDSWRHWFDVARLGYETVNLGGVWDDSIYACLVTGGVPQGVARVMQVAGTVVGAGVVYYAFRLPLPRDQKIAIVLAATVFAAPHSGLSDTLLLAVAAGLWSAESVHSDTPLAKWAITLGLWLAPIFNPPLTSPSGRLTPVLLLGFIIMTMMARRPEGGDAATRTLEAPPNATAAAPSGG